MQAKPFRTPSIQDRLIGELDRALNNIFCEQPSSRPYPPAADTAASDDHQPLSEMTAEQKRQAAGLMRVNHAGEMAAQALYQGQSLTARDPALSERLKYASVEESDHLNWCRRRLTELGEKPSILDPFWYAGSFAIGVTAGIAGDRWNLGFLAETEHQVVRHLDNHLQHLPAEDSRSRAIVTQMKIDEQGHAELAENLGAAELPQPVKQFMQLTSKVMTNLASRI
ncbi:MAG: demethoxyubiquinone hydroxylase family protein [Zetaproteobacteria bacterium CG12_big_fil_rev_8_21_14_0_65_54_13]|nr:MAG: demethoxyubiquinone hydroxylase family protein [Zetaproteobacteria bacterium CG23_combo_of_CG06-09_8_20_14_all_54_7]PIW47930.1 MAG: demethoxyubiquinone hydroxylase family protein [Zetaproteobacteria bacterium CG12_big_fil_rev_8_21_14_0_65_54_13]PIX53808.1 MAG: demethoxyubiquinone hydroxylase family protein [Zetaproteobacteria bacterium CG_4_10_14_3_um_filter_54_28]PJA30850.1 MAG: demethoxyubiquinone hydroxylase family protein [Zetaproteobacteria bacterium CG_4_9_14_3_um_filter_54_145]